MVHIDASPVSQGLIVFNDRRSLPDLLAGTRVEVDADLHSSGSTGKES